MCGDRSVPWSLQVAECSHNNHIVLLTVHSFGEDLSGSFPVLGRGTPPRRRSEAGPAKAAAVSGGGHQWFRCLPHGGLHVNWVLCVVSLRAQNQPVRSLLSIKWKKTGFLLEFQVTDTRTRTPQQRSTHVPSPCSHGRLGLEPLLPPPKELPRLGG